MKPAPFSLRALASAFAVCAMTLLPTASARADMSANQRTEIETVIKNYLMSNPEILRDAMTELDRRDKAKEAADAAQAVVTHEDEIFNSKYQTVLGNPNGKVTLVELFDYNCPHCRNVIGDLEHLMQANPDLRFVLKDFPILTPQSVEAAKVAIALRNQFQGDKFWEFHKKLMSDKGLVGQTEALAAAESLGANMTVLAKDMEAPSESASIKEVGQLADDIHAGGTPTFVIGDSVYAGEMSFDQLNPLIANVRKCGKVACA